MKSIILMIATITSFITTTETAGAMIKADAIEWTIRDIGTLSLFDEAHLRECNNNGQALIYGRLKPNAYEWAFWDPQLGLIPIKGCPSDGWEDEWLRVNENGLVVGLRHRPGSNNTFYIDLITWSIEQGYQVYKAQLTNKNLVMHEKKREFLARCRNSDLVVVNRSADNSENNQVLVLQNNKLIDMTPFLHKQAQSLGFDAGGWWVSDVNSRGMLLGRFYHYEKHPYRDGKLQTGTHYFMWDKKNFYLIDWPDGFYSADFSSNTPLWDGGSNHFDFDATGRVLFNWWSFYGHDSMMWTPDNGLKKLEMPSYIEELAKQEGALPPKAIYLLDDGTIVWLISYNSWICEQPKRGYIFENEDNYWFLPIGTEGKPIFKNLYDYPGSKLSGQSYRPLFQKSQGFIQVDVFDETHPFMIEVSQ